MLLITTQLWKTEGDALKAQGGGAVPDDLRVVPEEGDQLGGKDEAQDTHGQEEHGSGLDAEEKALPHPAVEPGTEVEAAHRLESLTEADHGGGTEGGDPLDHAHGGDGGVAVGTGGVVEADGGHAGQAQAAPATPMSSTKIKRGSSPMLSTAPLVMPTMA